MHHGGCWVDITFMHGWSAVVHMTECFYFANNPHYRAMNNVKPFDYFFRREINVDHYNA